VVGGPDHDQQHCYHHAPTVKPEAATAVVSSWLWAWGRPKHVELYINVGNKLEKFLHLVGRFIWIERWCTDLQTLNQWHKCTQVNYMLFSSDFNQIWIRLTNFREDSPTKFHKNPSSEWTELFQAGGRGGTTKLTVPFRTCLWTRLKTQFLPQK
jgi:hypothetical protein